MAETDVGGQRIYLEDRGEGSPVLLLHSSGLGSRQWRRLISSLVPNHRVLAPDFIGYGRSAPWRGAEPFHFSQDVLVAEVIGLRAGRPVHLVGHSYGGFVGLMVAAAGLVPLASITVFDPVCCGVLYAAGDQAGIDALEAINRNGEFFAPELRGTAEWCQRFVDYWSGPGYWSQLPALLQDAFASSAAKTFDEVHSLVYDRTPPDAYARISAATLIMTGMQTPLAQRRVNEILVATIPEARLESVENAGHMAPLTHAGVVDALIVKHIEDSALPD